MYLEDPPPRLQVSFTVWRRTGHVSRRWYPYVHVADYPLGQLPHSYPCAGINWTGGITPLKGVCHQLTSLPAYLGALEADLAGT